MDTQNLTGPDLAYWVGRANMRSHSQQVNVLRRHYGVVNKNDPSSEPRMRAFVIEKFGPALPDRSTWH